MLILTLCLTFVSTKVSADTTTPLEPIEYPIIPIKELRFIESYGLPNDFVSLTFDGGFNVGEDFDFYQFKNNLTNNYDVSLSLQNNSDYFTLSTISREFSNNNDFVSLNDTEFIYLYYENIYLNRSINENTWHVFPYGLNGEYLIEYYEWDNDLSMFTIRQDTGFLDFTTNPFDFFYREYEYMGLLGVVRLEIYCDIYSTNNVDFIINIPSTENLGSQNNIGNFFTDYDNINYEIPSFDTTWLAWSVYAFMWTPIFGTVAIGDILFIVVSLCLVIALLKYLAGG